MCSFLSWTRSFRWHGIVALLVLAHMACAQQEKPIPSTGPEGAAGAQFDLANAREALVSLDSGWRFHTGDDMRWADPAYDDSAWTMLRADTSWAQQGYAGLSGFAWYRFTLHVPPRTPGTKDEPLALELAPIITSYQLFFDGRFIAQSGADPGSVIPTTNQNYALYPLPAESPSAASSEQGRTIHVAIRVWHCPIWASYLGGGPWAGDNLFGDARLLRQRQQAHWNSRRLIFVDVVCYATAATLIGLTILALYFFHPREREYLWFGLLPLVKAADAVLNLAKELYAFPSIPIFDLLDSICIAAAHAALLLFLINVLHLGRKRLHTLLLTLIAVSPIVNMLYWPGWASVWVSALLQILCLLPAFVWTLAMLAERATVRRDETARLLFIPVLVAQGIWVVKNVLIALQQFGKINLNISLDAPIILAPYRIHPTFLAELLFLLAMLIFLIRRFTAARRREERFESELEAAREVQRLVLPAQIAETPGFAVESIYHPADLVGGDFFQIIPTPGGGLLVVAGDVAGKGLPAALMVSMLVGNIRAETAHTSDPAALLQALNESLYGYTQGRCTTCLCLHIDAAGQATASNAGHLNPYNNGREIVTEPFLPLGILKEATYPLTHFQLKTGDRLTILSDGVLEAQSSSGELFGFERTAQISTKSAAEIAKIARDFGQTDDITVLTITYRATPSMSQPAAELRNAHPSPA